MLYEEFDNLAGMGVLDTWDIPAFISDNINPSFTLRPYQKQAIRRFLFFVEQYKNNELPVHLLFNMATGSGKTLLMAANILYLYKKGYRYFLFLVNSTNIIEKTKHNFLNPASQKYLFKPQLHINHRDIRIREIRNLQDGNDSDIHILFTTVQGLSSKLYAPAENALTFADFDERKIVILSDEAHHVNLMSGINNQNLLESNAMQICLEEILSYAIFANSKNHDFFKKAGSKGGSTAFVFTYAAYATDTLGNQTVE
ncbi:DEAD/DEAH box helicase family protein [Bacillaceae bacterium Marseille-Q3522]|nr:DEAD/DEAH box helicase family protein [Bacillaceae bacterium Marseille-Q3522]